MPTRKVKGGYRWGSKPVRKTKAEANKDGQRAYQHGYKGHKSKSKAGKKRK